MKKPATHAPHPYFQVGDSGLDVDGRGLADIAEQLGNTPFYVYSAQAIRARVAALRAALPAGIELHYAMKANPMPEVVALMAGLVDGLDVASQGELVIALGTKIDPAEISFAGPGKRDCELAAALAAGVVVNLESANEMRRLARLAREAGTTPRVAVRVNPDFQLKTSGMKMGGGPQQFGIDAEAVPGVLQELATLPLEFVGFHIFAGSQNLRAEAIVEAQESSVELALRLAAVAPAPVRTLNIGGGFGIPYFPGETALDLQPVRAGLERLQARVSGLLPKARLVLELGRYFVGESGLYVCRVIDRKISRGRVFLVTDGGLHHHLAASGNFGQVIRKNYPVAVATRGNGSERENVSVVGPLCTPLDLLADRMDLARADVGDLIAVFQSGAYGLSASPAAFLGHPAAGELLL